MKIDNEPCEHAPNIFDSSFKQNGFTNKFKTLRQNEISQMNFPNSKSIKVLDETHN